jgi:hypothetical protein
VAGIYNPFATALWQFNGDGVLFNDGTPTTPSDIISIDTTCGYPDEDIRDFDRGVTIAYIICFGLSVLTLGITAYIAKRYWSHMPEMITTRQKYSFQDLVVIAIVFVDFF